MKLILFFLMFNLPGVAALKFNPDPKGFKTSLKTQDKSALKAVAQECKQRKLACSLLPATTLKNTYHLQVVGEDAVVSSFKLWLTKRFP